MYDATVTSAKSHFLGVPQERIAVTGVVTLKTSSPTFHQRSASQSCRAGQNDSPVSTPNQALLHWFVVFLLVHSSHTTSRTTSCPSPPPPPHSTQTPAKLLPAASMLRLPSMLPYLNIPHITLMNTNVPPYTYSSQYVQLPTTNPNNYSAPYHQHLYF